MTRRNTAILIMTVLLVIVGFLQGWIVSLSIIQFCLISAIMAMGVNIQWGYAGIFNVGVVGFTALGGLAAVLIGHPPVVETIAAGGAQMANAILRIALVVALAVIVWRFTPVALTRNALFVLVILLGYFFVRAEFSPAAQIIENTDAAKTGFLGGLGWPIFFSWIVGGALAGAVAWGIGKLTLGLRADYLAIATLGIAEIIVALIKNENWLTRGVKNVTGLPRAPIPKEVDLQESDRFLELVSSLPIDVQSASSIAVKLIYIGIFVAVLAVVFWLSERALNAPWGRMVRAIRDNRDAAEAMGKDVTKRHLQIFVLGSIIVGLAGAMMTTLDGQLNPSSYHPLRFTFLIWVMVIVGGSGNNWGAIVGAFFIWFFWIEAERLGPAAISAITYFLPDGGVRDHLVASAEQIRLLVMGLIMILTLRYAPRGLLPEDNR